MCKFSLTLYYATRCFFPKGTLATVLIWLTTALTALYAILTSLSFFHIMERAVSDDYMRQSSTTTTTRGRKGQGKLSIVHGSMPLVALLVVGSSVGLWYICQLKTLEEWTDWW